MKPLITIAVLNRNGLERLKKTTSSLLEQDYSNIEVLYYDNGSDDPSKAYLKKQSQKIRIIESSTNDAYGYAKNKLVSESRGDFILLLDNDIQLADPHFLTTIYENYKKLEKVAFLSPVVKDVDKEQIESLGLFYNKLQKPCLYYECLNFGTFKIPGFMGNAVFFKKSIFISLGGYDEIYPINIDDYDLSARAYTKGFLNYMTCDCTAIHHGIEIRQNSSALAWRYEYYFAGFGRMMLKNYTAVNLLRWGLVSGVYIFIKGITTSFKYSSISILFSTLKSVYIFFRDMRSTLTMRKLIQQTRMVREDKFLEINRRVSK